MITILLADDHRIMREGLRALLARLDDVEVVAEAADGLTAVKLAAEHRPQVAIIDISMPRMNGIEATRRIRRATAQTTVIALSKHTDKRFVAGAIQAGARGYLVKDCAFEELTEAIRTVAEGRMFLSRVVGDLVIEAVHEWTPDASPLAALSEREHEVFKLICEGHSTKEVADLLHVSSKTVTSHRQHVMEKLGISSIAELTRLAIREGVVSLDE